MIVDCLECDLVLKFKNHVTRMWLSSALIFNS